MIYDVADKLGRANKLLHLISLEQRAVKQKPLVQILLVSANSVRRTKRSLDLGLGRSWYTYIQDRRSLYVNTSCAKQFFCKQCVHHIAPKGFFVWALVYSLWWWAGAESTDPWSENYLGPTDQTRPLVRRHPPRSISCVQQHQLCQTEDSELRVKNQLSGFGLVGSLFVRS